MSQQVPDPIVGRQPTVYEVVGGREFFDRLVDTFYDAVEDDELLRPMYPRDLTASRRKTAGFLAQYWGGGTAHYSDERGHPRLRMRHMPFVITRDHAEAWLLHMEAALDAEAARGLDPQIRAAMSEHFVSTAAHMINTP